MLLALFGCLLLECGVFRHIDRISTGDALHLSWCTLLTYIKFDLCQMIELCLDILSLIGRCRRKRFIDALNDQKKLIDDKVAVTYIWVIDAELITFMHELIWT